MFNPLSAFKSPSHAFSFAIMHGVFEGFVRRMFNNLRVNFVSLICLNTVSGYNAHILVNSIIIHTVMRRLIRYFTNGSCC